MKGKKFPSQFFILLNKASLVSILIVIFVFFLANNFNSLISQEKNLEDCRNRVNEGKRLYENSRFTEAIDVLRKVIPVISSLREEEKKHLASEAHFYLGSSLIAQNKIAEAEAEFINLLKINEAYAEKITVEEHGPKIKRIWDLAWIKWQEEKKKIKENLAKEKSEMLWLEITAWPRAQIELDGVSKGSVPPVLKELVEEGEHEVKFTIEDQNYGKYGEPKIEKIIVKKGEPNKVNAKFDAFGALDIIAEDSREYDITLDGQSLGKTPLKRLVRGGTYTIIIKNSNYRLDSDINIENFKINIIRISLVNKKIVINREIRST